MSRPEICNWFGDLKTHPQVVVEANSVDDLTAILTNPIQFPSPVRAVGSNHSTTRCGTADGGTIVRMKMNRIRDVTHDSVTAEAGALYIDLAKAIENRGLQFHVNPEIGNLSVGSAACAGTKDASMPGEYGQVGSYVTSVKMVLPSGQLLVVTEDQPELLQLVRSSYGTFGIICEATFRVRLIKPMAVYHESFALDEFLDRLDELKARNESMMYYLFPFEDMVAVEFRSYRSEPADPPARNVWNLRNCMWKTAGPLFCHELETAISEPGDRYAKIDRFHAMLRRRLVKMIRSDHTLAADQIIRYPDISNESRYTFSLWAFPEDRYPIVLPEYFRFCRQYYRRRGYRCNLPNVGYRIAQDQQALLSYSYDGPVMTLDPVSTGNDGWHDFLLDYNEFCSGHGGIPLLNQTYGVTRAQVEKAFGERWMTFRRARHTFDPGSRLMNEFFRDLLGE